MSLLTKRILQTRGDPDLAYLFTPLAFPRTFFCTKDKSREMKPSLYSPTRYIHLLVQHLEQHGRDCKPVLDSLGIDRDVLGHPEGQMPPLEALMLFRALADQVGGSDIGLRVGKLVTLGALGDPGRALLSCATLRDTLHCCAEFFPLIAPSLTMQVQAFPTHVELRWLPVRPLPFDFLRMAYDMAIGGVDSVLGALLGERLSSYDVFFTHRAPPHADLYRQLTKAHCHFDVPGLPYLRLRIHGDVLNTPMPLANPVELAILRKRLSHRVALTPLQGHWADWVGMLLEQANEEQPSLEMLAGIVHVSPSTLSRNLAAEGHNFRKLASQIRHKKACHWLREGQMSVSEIAQRLGYADLPSFVRAFKSISGMSPTKYAAQAFV